MLGEVKCPRKASVGTVVWRHGPKHSLIAGHCNELGACAGGRMQTWRMSRADFSSGKTARAATEVRGLWQMLFRLLPLSGHIY